MGGKKPLREVWTQSILRREHHLALKMPVRTKQGRMKRLATAGRGEPFLEKGLGSGRCKRSGAEGRDYPISTVTPERKSHGRPVLGMAKSSWEESQVSSRLSTTLLTRREIDSCLRRESRTWEAQCGENVS